VGGWTVDKVTRRRVQALIAGVHLNVHHIPALELNVTDFPAFAFLIAFEEKAALLRADQDHYLFTHHYLLSSIPNKCSKIL
jgi:hypothetical protein